MSERQLDLFARVELVVTAAHRREYLLPPGKWNDWDGQRYAPVRHEEVILDERLTG